MSSASLGAAALSGCAWIAGAPAPVEAGWAALRETLLNGRTLGVMLPAFALSGLLRVAVPSHRLLQRLGAGGHPAAGYGMATASGFALALCPCNVGSLFSSVWRSGAGAGPAFALLCAGPSLNVLLVAYTLAVLGPAAALWRAAAAAVMALAFGLIMARLVSRRATAPVAPPAAIPGPCVAGTAWTGLPLVAAIAGALSARSGAAQAACAGGGLALAALVGLRMLEPDVPVAWLREGAALLLRTAAGIVGFAFAAGAILALLPAARPGGGLWSGAAAAAAGVLLYFPALTETALAATFRAPDGATMAFLLAAPVLGVPGLRLVVRDLGWKPAGCAAAAATALAFLFGMGFELLR